MITIIDYDAGNVKSVERAFLKLGQKVEVTRDPKRILAADHVVLPGVGNFGDAMRHLKEYGLEDVIRQVIADKVPFLGICVGMQVLFEGSEESPEEAGLGILKGYVKRFSQREGFKVPQIGWNAIYMMNGGDLFANIPNGSYVYFVHSYYVEAAQMTQVKAVTEYANMVHASVQRGNLFATQFHPEKSGEVGLRILKNFIRQRKEKEEE